MMSRGLVRKTTGLAAMLLAAGCGTPDPGSRTAVRDSAGITIVENALPPDGAVLEWRIDPEPVIDIGAAEGPAPYQLYQVTGAGRLSDGSVAVANAGSGQLRVFSPDGRLLGQAGGQGGGPGEFRSMSLVGVMPGDSILIHDSRSARFSVMTREPAFARSFRATAELERGGLRALGRLADGRIVVDGPAASLAGTTSGSVVRPARPLLVLGPGGGLLEVLDTLPGRATLFEAGDGFSFTIVPFTVVPTKAVGRNRVAAGTGARYEIRAYDPDTGDLVRLIRLDRAPRPVTPSDIDRVIQAAVARAPDDAAAARLRRSYEAMTFPDSMPVYSRLVVDRLGVLWVEDFRPHGDAPRTWTVFDPDGRVLGTVDVPDFHVFEIGEDWILGLRRDELDIPHVVVHRLDRGPEGAR